MFVSSHIPSEHSALQILSTLLAGVSALASTISMQPATPSPAPAVRPSKNVAPKSADETASIGTHAKVFTGCDRESITVGETITLGIHFEIAKGWHIYWNGRNDSGTAPEIKLDLPDGMVAGPVRWPAPTRHVAAGDIVDHIYEGRVTLLIPIKGTKELKRGTIAEIKGRVDYLICNEACVPEAAPIVYSIAIPSGPDKIRAGRGIEHIQEAKKRLPEPPPSDLHVEWGKDTASITFPGAVSLAFFPDNDCVELQNIRRDGVSDSQSLKLSLAATANTASSHPLSGVLEVKKDNQTRWYTVLASSTAGNTGSPSQDRKSP